MAGKRGNHPKSASCPASRAGVTLIELLIVMTILLSITSVAMRMMRPDKDSRRMREAARAINVYFGSARARAMETGRPCGVKLERISNAPGAAMILSQVETPPSYSGDSTGSCCEVAITGVNGAVAWVTATFYENASSSTSPNPSPLSTTVVGTVDPSSSPAGNLDSIQFNGQGPWYTISGVTGGGTKLTAYANIGLGAVLPWNGTTGRVPYHIARLPSKSVATPLQLPGGAVADLNFSGTDTKPAVFASTSPTNLSPVIIVFAANGAIARARYWADNPNDPQRPTPIDLHGEPLYLLVGKRERIAPLVPQDGIENWQSLDNYWIAINPQNGLITVAEVSPPDAGAQANLETSRYYARIASGKGGN